MTYRARDYKEASNSGAGKAYVNTQVVVENIPVKSPGPSDILSIFVKFSAGALTAVSVYESIDGDDWRNATATAAYQGSTDWGVLSFVGSANYPVGTLLQIRATGTCTIDEVWVVQDW